MHKSKVIDILKSFSEEEFKRFEEMIISPYFNKNTNLIRLSGILSKHFPDFEPQKINKEIIWNELFNGKEFNYGVMKNLIYELNVLAEQFLILNSYSHNELMNDYLLCTEFKKRDLNHLFEKKIRSCKDKLSKSKLRLDIHYFSYEFEDLEKTYLANFYRNKNENFATINKSNHYLMSYFFSTFFYSNYNNLVKTNFFKVNPDYALIKRFADFYEKSGFEKNLLSDLYFLAIHISIYPEKEEKYFELKKLFMLNIDKLDRMTNHNMGAILSTYCRVKIIKNEIKYLSEQFDLLKYLLENNLYKIKDEDSMDPYLYFMILELSLKLDKLQWVEKFAKDYAKKLNPVLEPNVKILVNIILEMYKKNYEKSLELLSSFNPVNISEKFKIKVMEIKIYYCLEDYERVYALIKGGKAFLGFDKSLSDLIHKSFNRFLDYAKKIIDIKTIVTIKNIDVYKINDIRKGILENEMFEKLWLIELLEEIENTMTKSLQKRKPA